MTNVCVVVNEDVRLCFVCCVAVVCIAACYVVIAVFDCVIDLSVLV